MAQQYTNLKMHIARRNTAGPTPTPLPPNPQVYYSSLARKPLHETRKVLV